MHLDEFLFGALIYLTAAVVSVPIATRLGLGSVLGYLLAGILIGPSALGLVGSEGEDVMHFAEFGVIVMLFLVGLELQPSKLWSLRKPILGLGGLQVAGTALVIGGIAAAIGVGWKASVATGLILAMSSTAIVLQSLAEKGLLKTKAGQSAFSVLLFQDIAVIPILALLPLLAVAPATAGKSASLVAGFPAWAQALSVLTAVAAIIAAGRFIMRPLFRIVAGTGIREIFVAFALLIITGITLLMGLVGLSAALGTFLAGVVLADSEYRHELEMDLDPFKGLLLAVFFIAVGAGIDFGLLAAQPMLVLGLVLGLVAIKLAVLYLTARVFSMGQADASMFSFSLAQGGEFAFVLITFAAGLGILAGDLPGLLVAAVALSMALAPLLMIFDQRAMQPRFLLSEEAREADVIDETGAHAIIAGHGRFGMTIGRLLNANGFKSVVLEHDASQIEVLRRFGFKVFYGDASRLDLLEAAGAREARVLIIAIDDREKTMALAETAHKHFPHLKILARVFDRGHAYEMVQAGFTGVYREVFGSSLDLAEDALAALGMHPYEAARAARLFRKHDEEMLQKSAVHAGDQGRLIDIARESRVNIEKVLAADRGVAQVAPDHAWDAPDKERE
jgi:monovalent cation:proton antiporter-2 (CPA2) family protein